MMMMMMMMIMMTKLTSMTAIMINWSMVTFPRTTQKETRTVAAAYSP